ncbi:MAG TPA: hypothetical protein VEU62_18680 [Bryobacterales bacterium]|nr:hypothetical protein [Bryobacterales bacterium]
MPAENQHRKKGRSRWWPPVIAYLLLASIYLLYLPHAEFVLDDWLVLGRYEAVRQAGAGAEARMALAILQNQFHNQFRFQWISFGIGYLLFLVAGYSPRLVFALFLLLHAGCAEALRRALEGLGIARKLAFVTGAVFVLAPSTHGPLFWSHNCSYYIWSTFWFLLYLGEAAACLREGRLTGKSAGKQALFLLLALFSGDPVFGLLVAGAPLAAWFVQASRKAAAQATLLAWGTVGVAASLYAFLINRAPILQQGIGLRYSFSAASLRASLVAIVDTYGRLTGVTARSFYHLRLGGAAVMAGALAALIVLLGWRAARVNGPQRGRRPSTGRTLALAGGLWIAAYGPIWFLKAHEFRYDYVPSPFLALALTAAALAIPRARAALAAGLVAWMAVATVADIRQCWIPQSDNLRAIARALRGTPDLAPGDLIVVSNIPLWIGTAPHFAFMADWGSTPFAEHATGVHGLQTACEIVDDGGRLRAFHYDGMRDLEAHDAARTHVLVVEADGRLTPRRLLAEPVRPGEYRLYALKGYAGPPVADGDYTRPQLALEESEIYFTRPFSHHTHER